MTDFTLSRGDTVDLAVVVTASGSAYSLVGCSIWFTAKSSYSLADTGAQFQKTIGSGITVTNAALGRFSVRISPADTSSLGNSKTLLVYDCQVKDASGNIYTIASGNLIILPDVTRNTV
jgi:hypothetical protein